MKSRLLVAAVACLGYAILNATPAYAVDYEWVGDTSTAWSNPNNWDPDTGYPGSAAADTATVGPGSPHDPTLDVDLDGTASAPYRILSLEIQQRGNVNTDHHTMYITDSSGLDILSTGLLDIQASGTVVITGGGDADIDGEMRLAGAGSTLSVTSSNLTLTTSVSGHIKGEHDTAEIRIDDVTLISSGVEMRGQMRFVDADEESPGSFTNQGKVIANVPGGTIDFQITGATINDTAGSERWQVTASGAVLRFLTEPSGASSLSFLGDFVVSNGILWAGDDVAPGDDIDVVTTGNLTHTGGKIIAGVDDSFTFNN